MQIKMVVVEIERDEVGSRFVARKMVDKASDENQ